MLKFNLSTLLVLLFGIVMGLLIGARQFLLKKKKTVIKEISSGFTPLEDEEITHLKDTITRVTSYHFDTRRKPKKLFGLIPIKRKKKYPNPELSYLELDKAEQLTFASEIKWVINRIAAFYYPDSKYPLFEVSIDELMEILNNTLDVLKRVIFSLDIPDILKVSVNDIIKAFKISLKAKDVATSKQVTITLKFISIVSRIIHLFTPIYWIKLLTKKVSSGNLNEDIMVYLFEIIATEALYVYRNNKLLIKTVD